MELLQTDCKALLKGLYSGGAGRGRPLGRAREPSVSISNPLGSPLGKKAPFFEKRALWGKKGTPQTPRTAPS